MHPHRTRSAPLKAEQESIFRTFFAGRVRFGCLFSIFRLSFEATTKKGRQLF